MSTNEQFLKNRIDDRTVAIQLSILLCGKGVESNLLYVPNVTVECKKIKNAPEFESALRKAINFERRKYSGFTSNAGDDGDVTLDGDVTKKCQSLYDGGVLSSGGGEQEAVVASINYEWKS